MIDDAVRSRRAQAAYRVAGSLCAMQRDAAEHKPPALARRAALRSAVGAAFGGAPTADAAVLRILGDLVIGPDGEPVTLDWELDRLLDDIVLVTSAVAASGVPIQTPSDLPPEQRRRVSFGRSMRVLLDRRLSAADPAFAAMIAAAREDLPPHLNRAMRLLASSEPPVTIDAAQLILDLGRWDDGSRVVQRAWSYHFWSGAASVDRDTTTEDER